jgi:phage-related protein
MVTSQHMKRLFQVKFLDDAVDFLSELEPKVVKKIIYNIDKVSYTQDPTLLKKLSGEIWEFRTRFGNDHYRMLAFWDRHDSIKILIICTHGFIKKTNKVPHQEILKAGKVRDKYFK